PNPVEFRSGHAAPAIRDGQRKVVFPVEILVDDAVRQALQRFRPRRRRLGSVRPPRFHLALRLGLTLGFSLQTALGLGLLTRSRARRPRPLAHPGLVGLTYVPQSQGHDVLGVLVAEDADDRSALSAQRRFPPAGTVADPLADVRPLWVKSPPVDAHERYRQAIDVQSRAQRQSAHRVAGPGTEAHRLRDLALRPLLAGAALVLEQPRLAVAGLAVRRAIDSSNRINIVDIQKLADTQVEPDQDGAFGRQFRERGLDDAEPQHPRFFGLPLGDRRRRRLVESGFPI